VKEQGNFSASDLAGVFAVDKFTMQHGGALKEDELQQWADAQMLKSRMAKIRGRVKIRGVASPKPGTIIKLGGVGERFNGDVYVSGVRHELSAGSWHTHIQFGLSPHWFAAHTDVMAPSAAGTLPGIKGLHIGVVTDLEDPDGEFRVKVKVPNISTEEDGTWARVATPDAGKERGMFIRPELEDEVVVGFFDEDPRYAVVLGCLFSSKLASPIPQTSDNDVKGIHTRSKMKWEFDDKKKSITIETPAGKIITMDEDAGKIEIVDENKNKITMDSKGIIIESASAMTLKAATEMKFEAAQISGAASATLKMEGSASAEVSSSGNMTVKGAMVMIN
jgi:Rhs element Vgr protein